MNESHLPRPRPVLDGLFALDCSPNVIMLFIVDQHLEAMPFGEAIDETLAVLVGSAWEVAGHADIERAVTPVGHHINPATHSLSKSRRGSPGQAPRGRATGRRPPLRPDPASG